MKSLIKSTNGLFSGRPIREVFNRNLTDGISVFNYRGYIIRLAHNKNEYLRLSCSDENMLVELISIGNEVMSSHIVASYLMDSDDFSELMPTAEWNNNPNRRQRELRDNNNLGFKCVNLRLYNDCEIIGDYNNNVKKLKMVA